MNLLDYKNETVQNIYFVAGVFVVGITVASIFWYKNRKSVEPERSDSVGSNSSFVQDPFAPYGTIIGTRNQGGRRMRKKYSKNKNKK